MYSGDDAYEQPLSLGVRLVVYISARMATKLLRLDRLQVTTFPSKVRPVAVWYDDDTDTTTQAQIQRLQRAVPKLEPAAYRRRHTGKEYMSAQTASLVLRTDVKDP